MATVVTPGSDSGSTTRKKAPSREQPSTMAACSTSIGNCLKKPHSSQTPSGRVMVQWERIRAKCVLARPIWAKMV